MTIDRGPGRVDPDDQCPKRTFGLTHMVDLIRRPDGTCLECGVPLALVKQIPPPPPPPPLEDSDGAKKGVPTDPAGVSLIERVIALRNQPTNEREAGWIGREGDMWEGHRAATDVAAFMVQQSINQISRLQPRESHSSRCIDSREVLTVLGQATPEARL